MPQSGGYLLWDLEKSAEGGGVLARDFPPPLQYMSAILETSVSDSRLKYGHRSLLADLLDMCLILGDFPR